MSRIYIEKKLLKECLVEAFEKGWAGYRDLKEEVVDGLIQMLEQQDLVVCRSTDVAPIVISNSTSPITEISTENWQTTISNAVSPYIESSIDNSIYLPISTFNNANA